METNWAAEHLQVIRTLMERSAVYRRALAPIMVLTGSIGLVAALMGWVLKIESPHAFVIYWLLVSLGAVAGAFLLVRKQALKEAEPFWSPPTRRVAQALLPALAAGLMVSLILLTRSGAEGQTNESRIWMERLPAVWIVLYGCALHAAGFFMPRGMKIFGWCFVLGGCALLALGIPANVPSPGLYAHGVMGLFFGAFHFAYGIYLYFTEQRKHVA